MVITHDLIHSKVLYIDAYVLNDDGNLTDATMLAVLAALKDLRLPQMSEIAEDDAELPHIVAPRAVYVVVCTLLLCTHVHVFEESEEEEEEEEEERRKTKGERGKRKDDVRCSHSQFSFVFFLLPSSSHAPLSRVFTFSFFFLHSTMLYADVHGFDVDLWLQRSVELASWPIAVSYGFWEDKVLADPTGEEVCRLQVSIIVNLLQSIFARRPRV